MKVLLPIGITRKTRYITTYKAWEVVLLPFPFTNLKFKKRRPALIVSPDSYNDGPDVVVMFVTSNLKAKSRTGDYVIKEWQNAGFPKPSMTRMKFATIDRKLIVKKFARLKQPDIKALKEEMISFFNL